MTNVKAFCGFALEVESRFDQERKEKILYYDCLTPDLLPNFFSKGHGYTIWRNLEGQGYKNRFVVQQDGQVIVDYATGLMWQRSGSDFCRMYTNAQSYIDELNKSRFAGYSDWRLPTLEEAMSLVEREATGVFMHIDPVFDLRLWTIWTADKRNDTRAWLVLFNAAGCDHYELGNLVGWVRGVR